MTVVGWLTGLSTNDTSSPTLIVLHGLEGSPESSYARMLLQAAADRNWCAAVLHFSDYKNYRNQIPQHYHAGATNVIRFFIEHLRTKGHEGPMIAAASSVNAPIACVQRKKSLTLFRLSQPLSY